ncbi:MAG: hypothetical protein R3A80_08360 [Bdellovibrionota bacterium]
MQSTLKTPFSHKAENGKLSNAELFFLVSLASWVMLFGTLILSFILARIKTPLWPPPYIESFPLLVPSFSTLAIGLSSVFVTKGFSAYKLNKQSDFKFYWLLAIVTGLLFGTLQTIALTKWMTFDVREHVYSSSVAFLILFHGVHFILGLSGLLFKFFNPSNIQSLRLWSWFWHFLGVVWLAIFMAIAL